MDHNIHDRKIGVLGGGQLGKMLAQAANDWHLPLWALDKHNNFPAGRTITHFVEGDFKNYEDVMAFGRDMDILTIEIEHVNTAALKDLEAEGKWVYPQPDALNIIKDKGLQKQFYDEKQLPTAPFRLYKDADEILEDLRQGVIALPFVQKSRLAGYDGKGVAVFRTMDALKGLFQGPSLVEPLVDIDKELAVIVARNPSGETAVYPVVEMVFHPTANLLEFQQCPASINTKIAKEAQQIALACIEAFELVGLLAVELFLTKEGSILINEVAPRPHNSGHHSIEGNLTSQFQQLLRAILDLPLGSTDITAPSAMVNLLGSPDHTGRAIYSGLEKCFQIPGAYLHIYGKEMTKPYRKMGHATCLADSVEAAGAKAKQLVSTLNIIA